MSQQILEKISASGIIGIKKAELKKEFGKDCDSQIEQLVEAGDAIVDQKGISYFVWTKDNYFSHISKNDPKYKILFNKIKEIEDSISQQNSQTNTNVFERFKSKFNETINEMSTSLGWISFADIRTRVCASLNISQTEFYNYASSLITAQREKYEISTGGTEGLLSRGLVHGYVRRL